MDEFWRPGPTPEEEQQRREALERLAAAARRVGLPREQLAQQLRKLLSNEEATRQLLAEIYGAKEEELDETLRRSFEF